MLRLAQAFATVLLLSTLGCASGGFGESKIRELLETKPLQLDAEQVSLTMAQLDCGVRSELWEPPALGAGDRQVARLMEKGRAAKFTDDVIITPGVRYPAAQVRGEFSIAVIEVLNIKDEKGGKLVEAKVGVYINNTCFNSPLTMMGIRRGDFSPDAAVQFRFLEEGGWHLDRIVH